MLTVAPGWTYALHLPHDPRAPRIARTTLRAVLDSHAMGELAEIAELLASELVTNAYRHTDGPSSMRLRGSAGGRLRVTVRDTDPTVPAPFDRSPHSAGVAIAADAAGAPETAAGTAEAPDTEADGGRGLEIVRLCADNWGSCLLGSGRDDNGRPGRGPRGKLLWVELVQRTRFVMAA
ncbi:ATP-binding protein [Streptomyces sp. NPDC048845]|uniref:ATP-binding protein n=1 Tax=Streptomyces sp. NPDC048845 TaxID=3155390 RepID=UPI00341BDC16